MLNDSNDQPKGLYLTDHISLTPQPTGSPPLQRAISLRAQKFGKSVKLTFGVEYILFDHKLSFLKINSGILRMIHII